MRENKSYKLLEARGKHVDLWVGRGSSIAKHDPEVVRLEPLGLFCPASHRMLGTWSAQSV